MSREYKPYRVPKRRCTVTQNRLLLKKKKYVKVKNEEENDFRTFLRRVLEERGLLTVDVRDTRSSKGGIKTKSGEENQRKFKIKTALNMRNRSGEKKHWLRSRINNEELRGCELRAWIFCSEDVRRRIWVACTMLWSYERSRRQAVRRKSLFQLLKAPWKEETKVVSDTPEDYTPDPLIKAKSDIPNLKIFLHRSKKQTVLITIYSLPPQKMLLTVASQR